MRQVWLDAVEATTRPARTAVPAPGPASRARSVVAAREVAAGRVAGDDVGSRRAGRRATPTVLDRPSAARRRSRRGRPERVLGAQSVVVRRPSTTTPACGAVGRHVGGVAVAALCEVTERRHPGAHAPAHAWHRTAGRPARSGVDSGDRPERRRGERSATPTAAGRCWRCAPGSSAIARRPRCAPAPAVIVLTTTPPSRLHERPRAVIDQRRPAADPTPSRLDQRRRADPPPVAPPAPCGPAPRSMPACSASNAGQRGATHGAASDCGCSVADRDATRRRMDRTVRCDDATSPTWCRVQVVDDHHRPPSSTAGWAPGRGGTTRPHDHPARPRPQRGVPRLQHRRRPHRTHPHDPTSPTSPTGRIR